MLILYNKSMTLPVLPMYNRARSSLSSAVDSTKPDRRGFLALQSFLNGDLRSTLPISSISSVALFTHFYFLYLLSVPLTEAIFYELVSAFGLVFGVEMFVILFT